ALGGEDAAQIRMRVRAELAPTRQLAGEEAVEPTVLLVRREGIDARRQRDLAFGGEVLERRAERHGIDAADARRLAAQHLDELSPDALGLLERRRRRARGEHLPARARL